MKGKEEEKGSPDEDAGYSLLQSTTTDGEHNDIMMGEAVDLETVISMASFTSNNLILV
jgi:hypothetical protein